MKRASKAIILLVLTVFLFSSCGHTNPIVDEFNGQETDAPNVNLPETDSLGTVVSETEIPETDVPETDKPQTEIPETDIPVSADPDTVTSSTEMFSDRDMDYTYFWNDRSYVIINLNGDSVSCDSKSVQINKTTVIIKNEGTYLITGELNDGQIVVNAGKKDKVNIILGAATINSSTSAPLYVLSADKVFVTLDMHTANTLSNGGEFIAKDENNIDGVIYSKSDITINGQDGFLTINSPAGHGIVGKDDVVLTSGQIEINSASHGIDANDSVRIANAKLIIDSGKDGIHVENSDDETKGFFYAESGNIAITSAGDGISSSGYMTILGGKYNIVTGGGYVNGEKKTSDMWGMGGFGGRPGQGGSRPGAQGSPQTETADDSTSIKGIKSTGEMTISGGTFTVDSADDTIHSNASVTISGGSFELSSGDDGIHADETLTIISGMVNITESYEGLEALDIKIEGGTINLVATDDGINAAGGTDSSGFSGNRGGDKFGGGFGGGFGMGSSDGSIVISGGTLKINASGDGIDANGTLEITGGYTTLCGPTQGDTAVLDYDVSATITGGTFIGTGSSMMAQTFSKTSQGMIAVSVGNQPAGAKIIVKDSAGNVILEHTPELSYQIVLISMPELVTGETYTLYVGSLEGNIAAQ